MDTTSRRRRALLAAGAVLAATTLAGAPAALAQDPLKATYVSTGPIGVDPFLELIADGLTRAGEEFGVETSVTESTDLAALEDNLRFAIEDGNDLMDFNEIWTHTPFFGKFLWAVLLFMSVWSLSVSIGKWWNLRKAQKETIKFAPEFSQFLEEDNLGEAIKLAEGYKKSHVARVLGGALAEVKPLIMDGSVTVSDINTAERAVEREMLMEMVQLKRGLAVLATVGATAPFVGLLGTVFGIINAFVGMATSGGAGIAAISAGIAEALIATGFGLIVAIPAVWFYNYFTTKIDNLAAEMTYTSKEMIDYLIKGVSGEFGRSRFTREFNTQMSSGGPVSQ